MSLYNTVMFSQIDDPSLTLFLRKSLRIAPQLFCILSETVTSVLRTPAKACDLPRAPAEIQPIFPVTTQITGEVWIAALCCTLTLHLVTTVITQCIPAPFIRHS